MAAEPGGVCNLGVPDINEIVFNLKGGRNMFLNELQEGNKELFLQLCLHASLVNGTFAGEEKEMICAYCREMNIAERIPEWSDNLTEVVTALKNSTDDTEKKIIILEILGLTKSDGVYDDQEKGFIESLANGLQVKGGIVSKLNSLLEIYGVVCKEIHGAICE